MVAKSDAKSSLYASSLYNFFIAFSEALLADTDLRQLEQILCKHLGIYF